MTANPDFPADTTTPAGAHPQPLPDAADGSYDDTYEESDWKTRLPGQLATVALAAVAGAVGAQLVYWIRGLFPAPSFDGQPPFPPEVEAAADLAELGDMTVGFAMAGALLAAAVGAGLWFLRGSSRAASNGALIGLLAGALLGALGGALNTLTYRQLAPAEFDEIFKAMMIHAPFWICMSIAVGMAVGIPLAEASTGKVIGATLGAAVLASLLYPLLSMLLFAAAHTDRIVPDFGSRTVGFILGSCLIAWAAVRSVTSKA